MEAEWSFEILFMFLVISDEAKDEQFQGGIRQNPFFFFFFLKSQFFRSAGNVTEEIKKVSPKDKHFKSRFFFFFFFLKSQFFRSAGNVTQQIKKVSPKDKHFKIRT